jgi:hypothetical protein
LNLEYERHYAPPIWPSKNGRKQIQRHWNVLVGNLGQAMSWSTESGAMVASEQLQPDTRLLAPAAHPFCLFV